jgi:hypothetical protein
MKSRAKGREIPALQRYGCRQAAWRSESEHENHTASTWKTESLSSYAQAQGGSVLFALVESIRGG